MQGHALLCAASAHGFDLCWSATGPVPTARADQVLVAVHATAVNPIDVKRASGYGARIFRVKGAAGLPRALGNDFVGVIAALGPAAKGVRVGQRVWGVVDTGPAGAHASHVLVRARQVLPAPAGHTDAALAVLPYTFCTLWRALRDAGIAPGSIQGKHVLVYGASGGLGTLALQVLRHWGAHATAVCSALHLQHCLAAGAHQALDRAQHPLQTLPSQFHAVLNFATWAGEARLAQRLGPQAFGMASTTHPLLGHLDRLGWIRGLLQIRRDRRAIASIVRQASASARYRWTVFRPEAEALRNMQTLTQAEVLQLPVGRTCSIQDAGPAFAHVAAGAPGRAVLTLSA